MKKLNLQEIYVLGKQVGAVSGLTTEEKVRPQILNLWTARSGLEATAEPTSPLLEATKRAAKTAAATIDDLISRDPAKVFDISEEVIFGYRGHQLMKAIEAFESVMSNEMPGVPAYIVSQKGIYRTEDLIENSHKHLSPVAIAGLPEQAKRDMCEAGRCLAFELSTACSFHLWRAVETVMASYYRHLTGKTFKEASVQRNWGARIKALREKKADKRITQFLDHIREEYRNPQTHPEAMVELSEAQTLFGAASSSINQMMLAVERLKKGAQQELLPSANEGEGGESLAELLDLLPQAQEEDPSEEEPPS